jgi:hypothetical protein
MRVLQAIPSPLPTVYSMKNSSNITELNFDWSLSETAKPVRGGGRGGYKSEKKNHDKSHK